MPLAPDLLHFEPPDDEPEPPVGPEPPDDEPQLPDEPEPPDEQELPVEPGLEETVAFISRVAANATVAAISYGSWGAGGSQSDPPSYHPKLSYATKWGDTTLSVFGTPARNVSYFIDPAWDSTAIDQWHSALALWSAVANITFTQVRDQASADFRLIKSNSSGTSQTFPNLKLSDIGASEVNPPGR